MITGRKIFAGYTILQVDIEIRRNKSLYWAGMIQLFYGVIESVDVAASVLIAIGAIPNIYNAFIPETTEIGMFMNTIPAVIVPIFFFFASLRILSGYWILLNRVKGFWLAMFVTGVSLVAVWFMLPLSALDLCILLPLTVLLLNGYYQEAPIISVE